MSGVGGARGRGGDDTGAAPATTTFKRGPRANTPADEEDVDDPASISSIGMEPLQPESEDIEEEVVHVEAAEGDDQPGPSDQTQDGGSKELKLILEGLERYFIFGKFVKTETKQDGRYSRQVHTGKAKCTNCRKEYSFTTQSRAHLKSHYDKMHKAQVPPLVAAMEGQSKRGRSRSGSLDSSKDSDTDQPFKRRQLSMEESLHKDVVSDEILRKLYLRWFIEVMLPLSVTDHPATRRLMCALKPDFNIPSRRTLSRDIDKLWEKARGDLINILYSQKVVATTADSWTAHNRAFLGMTVHWIDADNLQRKKATLACKKLNEHQSHQLLGQVMSDIHQEFGLAGKVAATTTDNGANYCATLHLYGVEDVPLEADAEEDEEDPEVAVGQHTNVHERLREEEADLSELPPHRCCSAHTLNLMSTVDIAEVPGWNHGLRSPWKKAAAKAQGLWNLQNKSSVAANQIKDAIKRKLKTPVQTRWNSYYDSVAVLLEILQQPSHLEAINSIIMSQPKGSKTPINEMDIKILTEYKMVMDPVATCLDRLQGETNAFMGILLPHLHIMKSHLERQRDSGNLQYAKPLAEALIRGFHKRFGHMYKDKEVLMATAIHPHYTPAVLRKLAPDTVRAIKDRLISELINSAKNVAEQPGPTAPRHSDLSEDPDVLDLLIVEEEPGTNRRQEEELMESFVRSLDRWQRTNTKIPVNKNLFPMEHRDVWVDLFIKYNTPIPSSAAVERIFSTAGDIIRPKRSSLTALTANNFEELVFMKGNMDLLGPTQPRGRMLERS